MAKNGKSAQCGAFYFMGFIGAAIFFLAKAPNFWAVVLGFLKAIVWPVFFVLEGFKYFAM